MNDKKCSSCGCTFPPTSEYFSKDSKTKDGLNTCCKICEADRVNIYYYNNHTQELERNRKKYDAAYFRDYRRRKRQEERVAATA